MKLKPLFFILILIVFSKGIPVYAQAGKTISGVVTTFRSFPLNHVTLKSLITGETTHTDSLGRFVIKCLEKDILLVSASGFEDKKIRTKNLHAFSIDLVYSNRETSFNDAIKNGHISRETFQQAIKTNPLKREKDYSKYKNIYELINNEILNVKVNGTSVITTKVLSLNLSPQVLYVVDDMIVSDISFVSPFEVKTIEYIDGVGASFYGVRGSNGVIKITLKK